MFFDPSKPPVQKRPSGVIIATMAERFLNRLRESKSACFRDLEPTGFARAAARRLVRPPIGAVSGAKRREIEEMVRVVGIEPTLCHQNRILSPARLPVPPHPRRETGPSARDGRGLYGEAVRRQPFPLLSGSDREVLPR